MSKENKLVTHALLLVFQFFLFIVSVLYAVYGYGLDSILGYAGLCFNVVFALYNVFELARAYNAIQANRRKDG